MRSTDTDNQIPGQISLFDDTPAAAGPREYVHTGPVPVRPGSEFHCKQICGKEIPPRSISTWADGHRRPLVLGIIKADKNARDPERYVVAKYNGTDFNFSRPDDKRSRAGRISCVHLICGKSPIGLDVVKHINGWELERRTPVAYEFYEISDDYVFSE